MPPISSGAGHVWTCDGCGCTSLWTDEHHWYGALKDLDDCNWTQVIITCSEHCRVIVRHAGKVPAAAELLAS